MFKPITREEYHKIKWKWTYWEHNCPFCDQEWNAERIFWKGKYWFLIYNLSSYSWDHRHIMAVPHKHILLSKDLSDEHFIELKVIHEKVSEFFWKETYFSFTRETINDNSRSIEHLHIHFLIWNLQEVYLMKMLKKQGYPIEQDLDLS